KPSMTARRPTSSPARRARQTSRGRTSSSLFRSIIRIPASWARRVVAGQGPRSHVQHSRAGELVAGEISERLVRLVEGVRHGGDANRDGGGQGEELLAVVPGVGGDAAHLPLLEEVAGVVEGRDGAQVDTGDGQRAA